MPTEPFHGVRVTQNANEPVIVSPISTSKIGMMLKVDPADLPSGVSVNTPISIDNPSDAIELPQAARDELQAVFDNNGGTVILNFIDEGADAAETAANAVGDEASKTGIHAFRRAPSLGLGNPKLLCMPGVAQADPSAADPVIAAAIPVANDLLAQLYIDGPNTTDAEAIAATALIGDQKRVCMSDPKALRSIGGQPVASSSSTLFAAVQSAMDRTNTVAWPATNVIAQGVVGVSREVDDTSEATALNEAGVNTIINRGDGFRLHGPMTLSAQTDGSVWQFVSVVRATDAVNVAIANAFNQFVGRPMTKAALNLAVSAGKNALRDFEASSVLLEGSRFGLANSNTATTGAQGIVKFGMAFEVPAPIYDLRITAYRNITVAYDLLFNSVSGQFDIAEAA